MYGRCDILHVLPLIFLGGQRAKEDRWPPSELELTHIEKEMSETLVLRMHAEKSQEDLKKLPCAISLLGLQCRFSFSALRVFA